MSRLAVGYEPDFDVDAEVGRQGELLTFDMVTALKEGTPYEVKTDERFAETGNVFIEYQCLYAGRWANSGIAITRAELWFHLLGVVEHQPPMLVFEVPRLLRACRMLYRDERYRKSCRRGTHPTRGICAPLPTLLSYYRAAGTA